MNTITANELKTQGVAVLDSHLQDESEAIITVRGKDRFVVMRIDQYQHLRDAELEAALYETRTEIEQGKFYEESIEQHMERVAEK